MEKGARRTGKTAWEIAQLYTDAFVADMKRAQHRGRRRCSAARPTTSASRSSSSPTSSSNGLHVSHVRRRLLRHGEAGRTTAISRASTSTGLEAGKRVELGEKRRPTDFALWKFSPPGEQRQMEWDSPWGTRLPGLAHRVLGDGAEVPGRLLRHPLRRRGPHPGPSHQRDRADRGARRHAARELLDARLLPAARTTPRWRSRPASSCASSRSIERGYDPLAYPLPVPDRRTTATQMSFRGTRWMRPRPRSDRMRSGLFALAAMSAAGPPQCDSAPGAA